MKVHPSPVLGGRSFIIEIITVECADITDWLQWYALKVQIQGVHLFQSASSECLNKKYYFWVFWITRCTFIPNSEHLD